ncbi:MAG: hypothetical protein AAF495_19280 [Pseudomonadota bacterium]
MNEALRLLRRALRRAGYDLKPRRAYDLAQLTHIEALAQGPALERVRALLDQADPGAGRTDRLRLHYRTCLRGDPNRPSGRVTGATAQNNVLTCLASTVAAVKLAAEARGADGLEVVVYDDRSEPGALDALRRVLSDLPCPWSIQPTVAPGAGPSLYQSLDAARGTDTLVYLCEDDFLHLPSAILEMWDFYREVHERTGAHLLLHPGDYPDRYKTHDPCYVLLGGARHWRTISHTTHTFLTHGRVLEENWALMDSTRYAGEKRGAESRNVNRLFDHLPGFSPLPSLACHLQGEGTLPPYFDWQALWDRYGAARED